MRPVPSAADAAPHARDKEVTKRHRGHGRARHRQLGCRIRRLVQRRAERRACSPGGEGAAGAELRRLHRRSQAPAPPRRRQVQARDADAAPALLPQPSEREAAQGVRRATADQAEGPQAPREDVRRRRAGPLAHPAARPHPRPGARADPEPGSRRCHAARASAARGESRGERRSRRREDLVPARRPRHLLALGDRLRRGVGDRRRDVPRPRRPLDRRRRQVRPAVRDRLRARPRAARRQGDRRRDLADPRGRRSARRRDPPGRVRDQRRRRVGERELPPVRAGRF
jgi:hypothetical protein